MSDKPRRVVLLAMPSSEGLDVVGTLDVFFLTNVVLKSLRRPPAYVVEVVSTKVGKVCAWNGLRMVADRSWRQLRGRIDTLIVSAVDKPKDALADRELLRWLKRTGSRARRVASLCSGAYLLAEAGLLRGRRATTHWVFCKDLGRRYPGIAVDTDPIYVRDGNVYTSAGSTASLDLVLALLEEDLGRRVALQVAQMLVLFLKRPGGQAQFSAQLSGQLAEREPIRELQNEILNDPARHRTIEEMAQRVGMSRRNFIRVFAKEVGVTPARFLERARVETARRLLEESTRTAESIARACGFSSAEALRTTFKRILSVSPTEYRARFSRTERAVAPFADAGARALVRRNSETEVRS